MTVRYCEPPPRMHGKPDWQQTGPLCKPGQSPDLPSLTRCTRCGGRVVRSTHTTLPARAAR